MSNHEGMAKSNAEEKHPVVEAAVSAALHRFRRRHACHHSSFEHLDFIRHSCFVIPFRSHCVGGLETAAP
jgi:hypothetical protein